MDSVTGVDRLLMMLARARSFRTRAEEIQKHRHFVRFWTSIEPALRAEHESVERASRERPAKP